MSYNKIEEIALKTFNQWIKGLTHEQIVFIIKGNQTTFPEVLNQIIEKDFERISNISDIGIRNLALKRLSNPFSK